MCLEVIDAFENEAMVIADTLEKVCMKEELAMIIFAIIQKIINTRTLTVNNKCFSISRV